MALLTGILGALVVLLLAAVSGMAVWLGYQRDTSRRRRPVVEASEEAWRPHVAALEVRMEGLKASIAEEAENARKASERARYYARRSAEAINGGFDEDDGDAEGEDQDVRGEDARRSNGQGMLPLSGDMVADPYSAEPEHVRRARALGWPLSFLS